MTDKNMFWDDIAKADYLLDNEKMAFISFDTPISIKAKI